jgi:hypothetical protein
MLKKVVQMTDQDHLDAWADTGDGYTVKVQAVLRCLWCDYISVADTALEAIKRYREEHENPIIERSMTQSVSEGANQ